MFINEITLYVCMVWCRNFHHSCERRQSYRFQNFVLTYVGLKFRNTKVLFQGKQSCKNVWVFVWYFVWNSYLKVVLERETKTPCFHRRSESVTSPLSVPKKSFKNTSIKINAIFHTLYKMLHDLKTDTPVTTQSQSMKT